MLIHTEIWEMNKNTLSLRSNMYLKRIDRNEGNEILRELSGALEDSEVVVPAYHPLALSHILPVGNANT